jgi:predicted ATP-binding protein involved in virulence
LILGDNGVGKTTLMQLLALGAAVETMVSSEDDGPLPIAVPRFAEQNSSQFRELVRNGQALSEVSYKILWAEALDQSKGTSQDESKIVRNLGNRNIFFFKHRWRSVIYGYGANRRRAPKGLTSETSDDPTQTLFDDDATLRNPEEWLLQNELVANTPSPLQGRAKRQRDRVFEILTRILPGIDEIRVTPHADSNQQLRASAEVHGPDGWVPFSALGLGYRTMTAWIVDLASRMFERYGLLEDPLAGPAVCLVDEIDLHLHPRWQRDLVQRLTTLFPNAQFIATAHSPLIVQAAPDANLVVLRRGPDGVVIDSAPRSVRKWRVDQILTSELFDIPSARAPELDALIRERDEILARPQLSTEDEHRLEEIRSQLEDLPHGDTPEDIEAMEVIRRAAKALKDKAGQ